MKLEKMMGSEGSGGEKRNSERVLTGFPYSPFRTAGGLNANSHLRSREWTAATGGAVNAVGLGNSAFLSEGGVVAVREGGGVRDPAIQHPQRREDPLGELLTCRWARISGSHARRTCAARPT